MEVIIESDRNLAVLFAAQIFANCLGCKGNSVLGLATGSTPLGLYRELIRMHREEHLDFSGVTTFNLDEYVGLPPEHPASYHFYMREHFFTHVNVKEDRIHLPDGLSNDIPSFCQDYEATILGAGGIDLQLLGIGQDGHIGFNEPSSSLASRTRLTTLAEATTVANQHYFPASESVPRQVITMGIGTILEAKQCLVMAFGVEKAHAVAGMVEGPVTAMCPASALQFHPQTTVVLDESAASLLKLSNYYKASRLTQCRLDDHNLTAKPSISSLASTKFRS